MSNYYVYCANVSIENKEFINQSIAAKIKKSLSWFMLKEFAKYRVSDMSPLPAPAPEGNDASTTANGNEHHKNRKAFSGRPTVRLAIDVWAAYIW